jgi:hypothetical protein
VHGTRGDDSIDCIKKGLVRGRDLTTSGSVVRMIAAVHEQASADVVKIPRGLVHPWVAGKLPRADLQRMQKVCNRIPLRLKGLVVSNSLNKHSGRFFEFEEAVHLFAKDDLTALT